MTRFLKKMAWVGLLIFMICVFAMTGALVALVIYMSTTNALEALNPTVRLDAIVMALGVFGGIAFGGILLSRSL